MHGNINQDFGSPQMLNVDLLIQYINSFYFSLTTFEFKKLAYWAKEKYRILRFYLTDKKIYHYK